MQKSKIKPLWFLSVDGYGDFSHRVIMLMCAIYRGIISFGKRVNFFSGEKLAIWKIGGCLFLERETCVEHE